MTAEGPFKIPNREAERVTDDAGTDIEQARTELTKAWNDRSAMSLIQAHIPVDDASDALRRLTERLSKRV